MHSLLIIQIVENGTSWLPIIFVAIAAAAQLFGLQKLSKSLAQLFVPDKKKRYEIGSQILLLLFVIGFSILYIKVGVAVGWAILWASISAVLLLFFVALAVFLMFPKLLKAYNSTPEKEETSPI